MKPIATDREIRIPVYATPLADRADHKSRRVSLAMLLAETPSERRNHVLGTPPTREAGEYYRFLARRLVRIGLRRHVRIMTQSREHFKALDYMRPWGVSESAASGYQHLTRTVTLLYPTGNSEASLQSLQTRFAREQGAYRSALLGAQLRDDADVKGQSQLPRISPTAGEAASARTCRQSKARSMPGSAGPLATSTSPRRRSDQNVSRDVSRSRQV
jgi:hypothetical protein